MVELVPEELDVAYEMVGIRQAIDELELQFSRLAATFDKGSHWEQEGSNSPIDWIRFNCHMTSNAAGARIAVGENLDRMAENTQDDGGLFLTGLLDPVGGALVRNALEPLARSSGADDYRDAPKRWADALVELAASKTRIQMQVTSSLETLLDLVGAPGAETEF